MNKISTLKLSRLVQRLSKITYNKVILSLMLLASQPAWATALQVGNPFSSADPYGISPFFNWKTIESEHFRITFPEEYSPVAQRVANIYEEAHQTYIPLFRWEPNQKTQVVLLDNQDSANGITSALGRFGMILWMTLPESSDNINYYDEWLRLLIFHEYTHFVNMDTTYGFYQLIRPVFLDLFLPNTLWPPWMLEGLAVYMETQFTSAGRGRSTDYEMLLRAAVQEKVLAGRDFITLDQVNGTNPYYPMGDTRYQFGYQLMNQVAKQTQVDSPSSNGPAGGKNTLGLLSYESGSQIPFFINDSLHGLIGKDWYSIWSEWTAQTRVRVQKEIDQIQAQPVTHLRFLTKNSHQRGNQVSGVGISPDGKWLAYTLLSSDQRSGLYLRDLQTQKTRRLSDKLLGGGMQFTPDSQALLYSEYNTLDQYSGLSDLKIYELESDTDYSLTERLRAKDPDISRDGKWVTFARAELSRVGLARAKLIKTGKDHYKIGPVETLIMPKLYERIANPKFSSDGTKIYYTFHPNAQSQENLVEFDLKTHTSKVLLADGSYHRFPAIDRDGNLYFISNATGVDNLYLYRGATRPSKMVTNVLTGVRFPCFNPTSPKRQVFLSHFSTAGWDLAETELGGSPGEIHFDSSRLKIAPPPAPLLSADSVPKTSDHVYRIDDYSVYPSILPRGIAPLVALDGSGIDFGAQTMGFDALDLHRYTLGASYSTQIQGADFYALYSNRTLGPDISFSGGYLTNITNTMATSTDYNRQLFFTGSISYPFVRTYSEWVPSLSASLQRIYSYQLQSQQPVQSQGVSPVVPNLDAVLAYSNQETSSLAVTSEGGRLAQVGLRTYLLAEKALLKAFFQDQEFLRLAPHMILTPSIAGEWTSTQSSTYPWANALLQGRSIQSLVNPMSGNSLNVLGIRGYPGIVYTGVGVLRPALDFSVPLARIFGGLGTSRVFFQSLYAVAFAETSVLWQAAGGAPQIRPAVGGGLRLSSEVFYLPVTLGAEYHLGLNSAAGGRPDLFFNILVSGMSF